MSSRPFAEATQAEIDSEVSRLLREAEETATMLLRSHQSELKRLASLLVEKETLDGDAVYNVLGLPTPEHRPDATTVAPHMPAPVASRAEPGPGAARPPATKPGG